MFVTDPENRPEIWGGLECTVARIGNLYRDQLQETGHRQRIDDLQAIQKLGVSTIRYPILWESIAPDSPENCDWTWHDERLNEIRRLGINPIAGLVHHGSGPKYTSLMDKNFARNVANHARNVANRYPFLTRFTPINEPLTTARFSGLYGHWYPHHSSDASFLRCLVHQCIATVLAMREIRKIIPHAQLVQTEDMGKTFSTPFLAYQAKFENQRRWLSFDLLCGRVTRQHPLWKFLRKNGISEAELDFLKEGDATPDIFGINHYLTSERYLDQSVKKYPEHFWGGNGRHVYADVEAVRMDIDHTELGPAARLREVWERYKKPIAVTEVHHGCTREEQLRWLDDVWQAAFTLKQDGVDIRAVTVWSMFGAQDWNSLLTQQNGFYEPGPFDIRSPIPRLTALAHAVQQLAQTGTLTHHVVQGHGWWKRESRFYHPPLGETIQKLLSPPQKILITGATGTLGRAFAKLCEERGLACVVVSRQELDITNPLSIQKNIDLHKPWAVINTAGFVKVQEAEFKSQACFLANTTGAVHLAQACHKAGIRYVTFSSDLVFNGHKNAPYVESDHVQPTSVYGHSKAQAEQAISRLSSNALIIRTSAFFGPWDKAHFIWHVLKSLQDNRSFQASTHIVSPTFVPDLVQNSLDILIDGERGIWHLANQGSVSWYDLACLVAERAGYSKRLIRKDASLPLNHTLVSERGFIMPSLDHALERYFESEQFQTLQQMDIQNAYTIAAE